MREWIPHAHPSTFKVIRIIRVIRVTRVIRVIRVTRPVGMWPQPRSVRSNPVSSPARLCDLTVVYSRERP
jgi:hypothetical protein